jgi:hypothetical protein
MYQAYLTNCTSPNAPLPMTLMSEKSSIFMRSLQMDAATLSSETTHTKFFYVTYQQYAT